MLNTFLLLVCYIFLFQNFSKYISTDPKRSFYDRRKKYDSLVMTIGFSVGAIGGGILCIFELIGFINLFTEIVISTGATALTLLVAYADDKEKYKRKTS